LTKIILIFTKIGEKEAARELKRLKS